MQCVSPDLSCLLHCRYLCWWYPIADGVWSEISWGHLWQYTSMIRTCFSCLQKNVLLFILDKLSPVLPSNWSYENVKWLTSPAMLNLCSVFLGYNANLSASVTTVMIVQLGSAYCCLSIKVWLCVSSST